MKKNETLTKIKDWFIINGIRFKNFVKEHKYVSSVVGLFLISSIVGLIVFAEGDEYAGRVNISGSFETKGISSPDPITSAKSFSTIVYDVSYKLSIDNLPSEEVVNRNEVKIKATFTENVNAKWKGPDGLSSDYELLDHGKTIIVTLYDGVKVGDTNTYQLYLETENISNGSKITTNIEVREGTSENYTAIGSKEITINSEKVNLAAKVVPGSAYKVNDFYGRYAPFGLLVGFDKSKLKNGSLEGLYFDSNVVLILDAIQNGVPIDLVEGTDYYGIYNSSLVYLSEMPNYVYNSGEVNLAKEEISDVTGPSIKNTTPELYLIGDKEIELKVGDDYIEYGITTDRSNQTGICKGKLNEKLNNCTRSITKINPEGRNSIITDESSITEEAGKYIVSYEYNYDPNNDNNKVIIKRTVNVVENDNTGYSLIGSENVTLLKGNKYNPPGISKDGEVINAGYEITIKAPNGDNIPEIPEEAEGTYTITYTVKDAAGNTIKELIRTVNIKEKLETTLAQTLETNSVHLSSGTTNINLNVLIDGVTKECNDSNNCSYKIYKDGTPVEYSSELMGEYSVVYTFTDRNGFTLQSSNIISFQNKIKYVLKIINMKSDGNIYYNKDNDFIALGSYFVNAKSARTSGDTKDINVTLTAKVKDSLSEASSSTVVNKNVSEGTKSNILSFNSDDNPDELVQLTENDYLSYGEDVVLRSVFTYSKDGDNPIPKLTTTIPLGNTTTSAPLFTMINYTSVLEDKHPYYINEEYKDKIKVKYYVCDMSASTSCSETKEYDEENYNSLSMDLEKNTNLKLLYLKYTLENVEPGAVVDFRIRLKTNIGNHGNSITLKTDSFYDGKTVSGNASINITAFKARTKLFVDDLEQDIMINGANTSNSTWAVYPFVGLPAQEINTTSAGMSLQEVEIEVHLPDGINFVQNENYSVPTKKENNNKTLIYVLKDLDFNEWIDPIYFDTSYDVNIESGSELQVDVIIQAKSQNNIIDTSGVSLRTTSRKITYINNDKIARSQYTETPIVSRNEPFTIKTEIYNNDKTTHSNLDIVTILPYNDVNEELQGYKGNYTISVPDNALCTTDSINLLTGDNLLNAEAIQWNKCTDGTNVTAVKVPDLILESKGLHEQDITIKPSGNAPGDKYTVQSYLVKKDEKEVIKFNAAKIEVFSRKITGTVWEDFDDNGIMDENEKKIPDVMFGLYKVDEKGEINIDDDPVVVASSDQNGNYSLSGLDVGKYRVLAVYNTTKYGLTGYNLGSDKSVNSSFDNPDKSIVTPEETGPDETENEDPVCSDESECSDDPDVNNQEEEDLNGANEENTETAVVMSDIIEITKDTKAINNINLGLTLRKVYKVKLSKYISKVVTTNGLGISTTKDYGNVTFAKLDVKDLSNLSVKVVYTLELENTGYYPGYIYTVKDYIPDGMAFNESYEENKGWVLNDEGYLENSTLFEDLVSAGEKKYLTIAFDITRKEAGSFINTAVVEDEDLRILAVADGQDDGGNNNEK